MKIIAQLLTTLIILCTSSSVLAFDAPLLTVRTSGLDVSLEWTSVLGAQWYTLYYAPSPYTGPDTINNINMGTNTSASYTLWDGASYYVAVTALEESVESGYSNIELVTITEENINSSDDPSENTGKVVEGDWSGVSYNDINTVECVGSDAQPVSGNYVYVSPSGSDSNAGTTEGAPLKTLAQALCNVKAGQTVYLLSGNYTDSVIMYDFGNNSSPIIIRGKVDDDTSLPVLDGERSRSFGFAIVQSKNIVIENLKFTNFSNSGLYVALIEDLTIENNVFSKNGFHSVSPDSGGEGFGLEVADVTNGLIKGNELYQNGPEDDLWKKGILGMGIDTYSFQGSIIKNKIYDNIGGGILVEEGKNTIIDSNEIYGNILRGGDPDDSNNYWDGGIWLDGGFNNTVSNNNIYNNRGSAITISDTELQYPYGSCKYTITGNTLTGNYWAFFTSQMMECPMPDEKYKITYSGNTVENNSYPGTNQDAIDGTDSTLQALCEIWPCGENIPCIDPESEHGDPVCLE